MEPIALTGASLRAVAYPVPYQPEAALIQIAASADRDPRVVQRGDVERWCEQLAAAGFGHVRSGALGAAQAAIFESAGFEPAQRLVVLRRAGLRRADLPARPTDRRLRHLDHGHLEHIAATDLAAFGFRWAMDPRALSDVLDATARVRARRAGRDNVGFLIAGLDRRHGYLQRLAVHPEHQGRGIAHSLVADALRWMSRWRATDVLVNTHHDNVAALTLYRGHHFVELAEPLLVLERAL